MAVKKNMKRHASPCGDVLQQFKRLRVIPLELKRKRGVAPHDPPPPHPAHRAASASRASQRAARVALLAARAGSLAAEQADAAVVSAWRALARAHGRLQRHVEDVQARHHELSERHLRTLRELHELHRQYSAHTYAKGGRGGSVAALDDAAIHVTAH